ncbi:MAG: CTP synthase [Candidatus Dadabacteria bacterium]|nr:CTP synthase [Candidatus Dadabacteria bacterium]NIQ12889.1 CTP synthase [Candidatus Dadabacteria bacterium]
MKKSKYIFVTGGVMSSLGKGIAASCIGFLLECRGLKVTLQKLDPYINVDPGTMNPFEHGEVFVTDDGAETDLDLGHYERFTNAVLGKKNNLTSGKVFYSVINKEREGKFLGKTVQVIPHITDEIKSRILDLGSDNDVVIVEIGGTVGDIESLPFLEAVRQLRSDLGRENTLYIHLTYVPYIAAADELKTKPTQHSVKELLQIGIQPDVLLCRTDRFLPKEIKQKIALFCNINVESVITAKDVDHIYEVPLIYYEERLDEIVAEHLNMWTKRPDIKEWEQLVERIKNPKNNVKIAVVGKYVSHGDAYKSLHEALAHGGLSNNSSVEIKYVDSEDIQNGEVSEFLGDVHGILVPGGFGERGIEGKIEAVKFARENKVPFFGICYGMQMAVVEFSRNVCKIENANTREVGEDVENSVIDIMESQKNVNDLGGTMRLGAYPCILKPGSMVRKIYETEEISERHRHRFEVNNNYRDRLEKGGLVLSGLSPDNNLVEIIELKKHPWFIGCQFHPEFKSKPLKPHPLFSDFIKAALTYKK